MFTWWLTHTKTHTQTHTHTHTLTHAHTHSRVNVASIRSKMMDKFTSSKWQPNKKEKKIYIYIFQKHDDTQIHIHTHTHTHNKSIQSAGGRAEFLLSFVFRGQTVHRLHVSSAHLKQTSDHFTSLSQISEHRHFTSSLPFFSPMPSNLTKATTDLTDRQTSSSSSSSHLRFTPTELHSSFRRWSHALQSVTKMPNPKWVSNTKRTKPTLNVNVVCYLLNYFVFFFFLFSSPSLTTKSNVLNI